MTLLLLKEVRTLASIYMLSVVPGELDTQGGRAERFCGVLASAEGSKIKAKENTWGGRWRHRRGRGSRIVLIVHYAGRTELCERERGEKE